MGPWALWHCITAIGPLEKFKHTLPSDAQSQNYILKKIKH